MTKLSCENEFCIYQKDGNCVLNQIDLDITGTCVNCIYVDLSEETLSELKANQLKNIEDRYF